MQTCRRCGASSSTGPIPSPDTQKQTTRTKSEHLSPQPRQTPKNKQPERNRNIISPSLRQTPKNKQPERSRNIYPPSPARHPKTNNRNEIGTEAPRNPHQCKITYYICNGTWGGRGGRVPISTSARVNKTHGGVPALHLPPPN